MSEKEKEIEKKEEDERPKIKTLVLCVGTGGVFYHGLTQMSNFMQRRETVGVILIDDDVIEDKNKLRQWGCGIGEAKVDVAESLISGITEITNVVGLRQRIEEPGDLLKCVLEGCKVFEKENRAENAVERVVVIHAPDNHLCRMVVHSGCTLLRNTLKMSILEITGGNTLVNGYAYGCVHGEKKSCRGDFTKRHPDIVESAEKERKRLENPLPCGSMGEDEVEQDVGSNSLTGFCVWSLAEKMVSEGFIGEYLWARQTDTSVKLWRREVKK